MTVASLTHEIDYPHRQGAFFPMFRAPPQRTRLPRTLVLIAISFLLSARGAHAGDVAATAAAIDREVDRRLAEANIPPSPPADDAEFLRRVCLDLTGRIPTLDRAVAFLDS